MKIFNREKNFLTPTGFEPWPAAWQTNYLTAWTTNDLEIIANILIYVAKNKMLRRQNFSSLNGNPTYSYVKWLASPAGFHITVNKNAARRGMERCKASRSDEAGRLQASETRNTNSIQWDGYLRR